jgi:Fe-S-cluster containining protein
MSGQFKFACTKCGDCCYSMGPVPLVLEDIENWVKNKVIGNMMPYIRILQLKKEVPNLYLYTPAEQTPDGLLKDENIDPQAKCPFFNSKTSSCQLNIKEDYRPLFCKTYPLEFDGKSFGVIDAECPGLKTEQMNEDLSKKMMKDAKRFYTAREELKSSMPALINIFQPYIIKQLMKMQEEIMKNMNPEDLEKLKKEK